MGLFTRRKTGSSSSSSPYQCEAAIESTSSFGSISHTPGATSRAFLPLGHMTDEPESAVSSLSAASGSAYAYSYSHSTANLPMSLARTDSAGPGMASPSPRSNSRPRARLHASASHHNLSHQGLTKHSVRAPPPLPSLPPQSHTHSASASVSYSYSSHPVPPGYLPMKSTPNLLKPLPLPQDAPSSRMYNANLNANASRASLRRGLGSNKEASASRVSLANAGRSLARVPSLWKKKFRRSQNSTNSDTSDSSAASKSSR